MTLAPSRHAEFKRLLHAAARELSLPRSHDTTQRLATIRLQRKAIREVQQRDLLSGKLSDPSKLLDADDRLRAEEDRIVATAPRVDAAPYFVIQPVKYVERPAEPKPPVVSLPIPPVVVAAGAPANGGVSAQRRARTTYQRPSYSAGGAIQAAVERRADQAQHPRRSVRLRQAA